MKSMLTTLCYIEKENKYLMLHRVKKKVDVNKDKWIGIGGHFEPGESPEECLLREAKEETGLTLISWRFRGIVTFQAEGWDTEYMCLYTGDRFEGELISCEEGTLEWVEKDKLTSLNLWEGDKIFLKLLAEEAPFFSLKLRYSGDRLMEAVLDGKPMELLDIRRKDGSLTGEVRERSIVHENGDLHGTTHVWIVRKSTSGAWEVLLQKRSQNKDSFPGRYDTSSAGHIPAGSDYLESALRELEEELGIHAESADLQFAGKFPISFAREFHGKIFRDEEIAFVYIYDHPVEIDHLTLQKEEVEEVQWFDLEETYQQCSQHRDKFCVPLGGLQLVRQFIKSNGNTIKE